MPFLQTNAEGYRARLLKNAQVQGGLPQVERDVLEVRRS